MTPGLPPRRGFALVRRFDDALAAIETGLVTCFLLAMVALYAVHVVLRNAGQGGVPAFQLVVQHLVLWVAMLGGSLAVREKKHIAIEALEKFVRGPQKRWVDAATGLATALVSGFLARVAWAYVAFERAEYERAALQVPLFEVAGVAVPRWWSLAILPAGFGLLSARFAARAVEVAVHGPPPKGRRERWSSSADDDGDEAEGARGGRREGEAAAGAAGAEAGAGAAATASAPEPGGPS